MAARTARGGAALACAAFLAAASSLGADSISFSADRVESLRATGKERTLLEGRARVRTGSISISADRIELQGKDFTWLECSGSVEVVDTDKGIRLRAPRLSYDRDKKLMRAQGPSILEDDKNKLVLKAEWIEDDGAAEVTLAQVAVRILKEKLACRAEYAVFRRKDKILELTGSPSARKEGDEYRAARIVVNTDTEEIKLEGAVSGTVAGKADTADTPPASGVPGAKP